MSEEFLTGLQDLRGWTLSFDLFVGFWVFNPLVFSQNGSMNHFFETDQSMIKAVDDETARELVARLCRAELRAQGLPESTVQWGGDQRAKDGGVDVYIDCPKSLCSPDFVPTAQTVSA